MPEMLILTVASQSASSDWTNFGLPVAAGVLVAVFSVVFSEYRQARRNSVLRFRPVERHVQTVNVRLSNNTEREVEQYVWRLPAVNTGSRPARSVTTELKEIKEAGGLRAGVVAAPLNWMHNPPGIFTREIFRRQVAYLDVCQWTRYYEPRPVLSNSPVMSMPMSNALPEDQAILRIEFYQESGQRADVIVKLKLHAADFAASEVQIAQVIRERRFVVLFWKTVANAPKSSSLLDGVAGTW